MQAIYSPIQTQEEASVVSTSKTWTKPVVEVLNVGGTQVGNCGQDDQQGGYS